MAVNRAPLYAPPRSRGIARRVRLLALVVVVIALGGVVLRWLLAPTTPTVIATDVVIVLDGGDGERLTRGLALVEAGVTSSLAISNGQRESWWQANRLCGGTAELEVVCFNPRPKSTAGEARTVARLAAAEGWQHLTVVTSSYHVARAHVLFDQCLGDSTVVVVPAGNGLNELRGNIDAVTRELVALSAGVTVARAC